MTLGARLILLREQLNSKMCPRCRLYYKKKNKECPHCSKLNDSQVEDLLQRSDEITQGSIWYLIFLMIALAGLFVLAVSIF
jgi:hypothetical protein